MGEWRASRHDRADVRSDVGVPSAGLPRSGAALAALVLFTWGISLLVFDWARRELFEPGGAGHLVLVVPFFGGAVACGIAAAVTRRLGRAPVGGDIVHRYGLASGLLGFLATTLLLWLGPRVHEAGASSRELRAVRQMEQVQEALEQHRRERGSYPTGEGPAVLADALAGAYLADAGPLLDPWGRAFVYEALNGGEGYLLVSTGRDGLADLPIGAYLDARLRATLGDDLVIVRAVSETRPSETGRDGSALRGPRPPRRAGPVAGA